MSVHRACDWAGVFVFVRPLLLLIQIFFGALGWAPHGFERSPQAETVSFTPNKRLVHVGPFRSCIGIWWWKNSSDSNDRTSLIHNVNKEEIFTKLSDKLKGKKAQVSTDAWSCLRKTLKITLLWKW